MPTPTQTMVAEARTALRCYRAGDLAGFDLHRHNAYRIRDAMRPARALCPLCNRDASSPYHDAACATEQARIAAAQAAELTALRISGAL